MKAGVSMILLLVLVAMVADVVRAGSPRLATVQDAFGVSSSNKSKCGPCGTCKQCHLCISKLGEQVKCVQCCDFAPELFCKGDC